MSRFEDFRRRFSSMNYREAIYRRWVTPEIDAIVDRMPKPVGSFGYDPWGYNERQAKITLAAVKWLYEHYFRVQATGLEQVPARGRVLLVANHSGQLPIDGMLIGCALATNTQAPRTPRAMIERFLLAAPYLGNLLNGSGVVLADPHNGSRMLENDEAIILFPEGVRGSGKRYTQRYQLQRFSTGFLRLAVQHNTPIVPVGVVGCEEAMPSLANMTPLARLLGLPYLPLGPLLPLPSRVYLNFGAPLNFSGAEGDEEVLAERVEQVRTEIRKLIDKGLKQRTGIFR